MGNMKTRKIITWLKRETKIQLYEQFTILTLQETQTKCMSSTQYHRFKVEDWSKF